LIEKPTDVGFFILVEINCRVFIRQVGLFWIAINFDDLVALPTMSIFFLNRLVAEAKLNVKKALRKINALAKPLSQSPFANWANLFRMHFRLFNTRLTLV